MLDNLSSRFQEIFKKVRGHGKLTEENVQEALREVRLSLLEADVNYKVVKEFINNIKEKSTGSEVLKGINPGQQFVKIVNDQIVELLGSTNSNIAKSGRGSTIVMLTGLQGVGKTTFAAKLAKHLKRKGETPFLIGADIYRPAAAKQLKILGEQINIPSYIEELSKDPVQICKNGIKKAKDIGSSYIIVDTAGRLHIDEALMLELDNIKKKIFPHEVLLVVDAMAGQESVNVAKSFNERLELDGIILTKLDGDARGGAALSIKSVTGKAIKFLGTGEKLDDIEPFYPERLASRILGMGDVVSLVEKAQEVIDEEEAKKLEEKMKKQDFNLEDFLIQLQKIKKMGPLTSLLKMVPGASQLGDLAPAEKEMKKIEAIIQSMTKKERNEPKILNGNRKKRVANGSGTKVQDVNRLLKQFEDMKKMMKMFGNGKGLPNIPGGFKGGMPF